MVSVIKFPKPLDDDAAAEQARKLAALIKAMHEVGLSVSAYTRSDGSIEVEVR